MYINKLITEYDSIKTRKYNNDIPLLYITEKMFNIRWHRLSKYLMMDIAPQKLL